MRKKFRLPSPAMTVACISLAVALSGASYAAITLPKNSVGPKQIRKNAVTTPKIKSNAVTGDKVNEATLGTVPSAANAAAIADNTVNAAKVVDNSLGGADINESNLGQVPDADTVDGLHAAAIGFTGNASAAAATDILSAGGLVVRAQCDLLGVLHLVADTTADNTLIRVATIDSTGTAASGGDDDYDESEGPINLLPGVHTGIQGTMTYSKPSPGLLQPGSTVTIVYTADEDAFSGAGTDCVVRGTASAYTPSSTFFVILP